ncbi:hypothetical protein ACJMK2_027298, partial [Sinanodonta woodiana]
MTKLLRHNPPVAERKGNSSDITHLLLRDDKTPTLPILVLRDDKTPPTLPILVLRDK